MSRYILKRIAITIVLLLLLSLVTFMLQRMAPTDPVRAILGENAPQQAVDNMRHQMGLDQPLFIQYIHYLGGLLHGDFGTSLQTRLPVSESLATFLPASLELVFVAFMFAVIGGLLIGLLSARKGPAGAFVRYLLTAGAAMPSFLIALLAILLFYRHLGWLPAAGRTSYDDAPDGPTHFLLFDSLVHGRPDVFVDAFKHLLLPALCIAVGPAVAVGRILRSSVLGTVGQDYVRTARAKGLSETRVMLRHILRNCLNSTMAMIAVQCGAMFAALLAVEPIFTWPGIGSWVRNAVEFGDYPAVLAVTLITSAIYITANAAGDVLQTVADPRIALT